MKVNTIIILNLDESALLPRVAWARSSSGRQVQVWLDADGLPMSSSRVATPTMERALLDALLALCTSG